MLWRVVFWGVLFAVTLRQSVTELSKLRIREGSKIFMRLTLKLNTIPSTRIFACAIGYRINWDILPAKKKKKKVTRKDFVLPNIYDKTLGKRDVYETFSNILDRHGLNGTSCLLRARCESSLIQPFDVKTQLFSILYPPVRKKRSETCEQSFDDCPLSLLHLLMRND